MCLFIETICVSDGKVKALEYHQQRLNRTLQYFYPIAAIDLKAFTDSLDLPMSGTYRLTITYGRDVIDYKMVPYNIRSIERFVCVEAPDIRYDFKYENRDALNLCRDLVGENEEPILIQNGLVTDTTYTNLIFYRDGRWFTPKEPLLKGTQRQFLLEQKLIETCDIYQHDLHLYEKFRPINAMMGWDNAPCFSIIEHLVDSL
ncbi:aminotransferase class IV [Halosquirtibacter laminarini]|uniref:Aminotransferase class IV n=1 Tax=Halosquirtibacter laminarini TaxID=3374600 RepID=A0AC61NHD2_9BACT|nr:aminotransferase class IV [Prolixibacteraceae bacterium]